MPQVNNHRVRYKPIEVGDRFSRLVVVQFVETRRESGTNQLYWSCLCNCGESVIVRDANLKNGTTRSCGCLQRERSAEAGRKTLTKHGEAINGKETVEYRAWRGMFQRVDHADSESKKRRYMQRGVKICAGLRTSYDLFLRLIGRKPDRSLSLDRANNNGHYSCGECAECLEHGWRFNLRWATAKQQIANSIHRNRYTGPAPLEVL